MNTPQTLPFVDGGRQFAHHVLPRSGVHPQDQGASRRSLWQLGSQLTKQKHTSMGWPQVP